MQVISSSLPPRFRVFQHPGYEHDGTITPAHLTTHQSVNPPISTTLPSSPPPPKKNDQKNPQGAIMTTRQTIAPPTPPNVKINSPISQKILSQNRTHFPTNPSHLVQNHPSPPNPHQLRQPRQKTDRRCRFIAHTADLSARTPSPPSSINRRCRLIVHPIDRAPD